ncbi:MAG: Yip1 family protein [Gammaproteobacteria bacterium]
MNTLVNSLAIVFSPKKGWSRIGENPGTLAGLIALHTIPLALIPAVCWYFGVSHFGWSVAGENVRLTAESALPVCVLFFLALIYAVLFLGYMVHWMAKSYKSDSTVTQGVALITYAGTPFFIAGVLGLMPILWLDIIVGIAVSCYCIYLLYLGTPHVMKVTSERGFLYSSAVFGIALVVFVGLLGATAILWSFGAAPEYVYAG